MHREMVPYTDWGKCNTPQFTSHYPEQCKETDDTDVKNGDFNLINEALTLPFPDLHEFIDTLEDRGLHHGPTTNLLHSEFELENNRTLTAGNDLGRIVYANSTSAESGVTDVGGILGHSGVTATNDHIWSMQTNGDEIETKNDIFGGLAALRVNSPRFVPVVASSGSDGVATGHMYNSVSSPSLATLDHHVEETYLQQSSCATYGSTNSCRSYSVSSFSSTNTTPNTSAPVTPNNPMDLANQPRVFSVTELTQAFVRHFPNFQYSNPDEFNIRRHSISSPENKYIVSSFDCTPKTPPSTPEFCQPPYSRSKRLRSPSNEASGGKLPRHKRSSHKDAEYRRMQKIKCAQSSLKQILDIDEGSSEMRVVECSIQAICDRQLKCSHYTSRIATLHRECERIEASLQTTWNIIDHDGQQKATSVNMSPHVARKVSFRQGASGALRVSSKDMPLSHVFTEVINTLLDNMLQHSTAAAGVDAWLTKLNRNRIRNALKNDHVSMSLRSASALW